VADRGVRQAAPAGCCGRRSGPGREPCPAGHRRPSATAFAQERSLGTAGASRGEQRNASARPVARRVRPAVRGRWNRPRRPVRAPEWEVQRGRVRDRPARARGHRFRRGRRPFARVVRAGDVRARDRPRPHRGDRGNAHPDSDRHLLARGNATARGRAQTHPQGNTDAASDSSPNREPRSDVRSCDLGPATPATPATSSAPDPSPATGHPVGLV